MPRLPQPGGDAGNWGEILNEYLSVEHKADGTLTKGPIYDEHVANQAVHRQINDNGTAATDLLSAAKIYEQLATKADTGHAHPTSPIGRASAWSYGFQSVTDRFPLDPNPPIVTFGGNSSTVFPSQGVNGTTTVNITDSRFQVAGQIFTPSTRSGQPYLRRDTVTSTTGDKTSAGIARVRFMTDAPAFDLCFLDMQGSQINLIIDGKIASRQKLVTFTNTGNFRYIRVDFGADVLSFGKAQTTIGITSGGSGYAIGEVITLTASTAGESVSRPVKIKVSSVSGGVVTMVDIVDMGDAASQPSGTYSQASTTGSGTGLVVSAQFFSREHTTRKMRKIELIYQGGADFFGVTLGQNDSLFPYYFNVRIPKLAVIGDSITAGTYLQYGGAHWAATMAQKIGLWDNLIISAQGGTGWITNNGTAAAWSHQNRINDYIAYDADIYLFVGSQNDGGASQALQDAITSTLNQLLEAKPEAYVVGIGNIIGASSSLAASIQAGFEGVEKQEFVRFINNQSPNSWFAATPVNAYWLVTQDTAHPGQPGLDYFAELAAVHVANALLEMIQ